MQRRIAVAVQGVHVVPQLPGQLHRGQRFVVGPGVLADLPDADPRRRHHRGRAVGGRQARVGAEIREKPHHGHVDGLRGQQERRRAHAVEHVAVAVPRLRRLRQVRVGAVGDEDAHHVEPVQPAQGHGKRRVAPEIGPARPHHLMQRRPALPPRVRVGSGRQQPRRDLVLRVVDGHAEGAGAVGQRVVGVGPGRQQHVEGAQTAFPGREQQRRESPRGPRVQVGPGRDQRCRRARVVLRGGPHQRRLAPPALDRVDLGAVLQQDRDRGYDAGPRHRHQRSLAFARRAVGVRAGLEQHPQRLGTAVGRGEGERRDAVAGRRVHLGAGLHQSRRDVEVLVVHGPVQRGGSVRLGSVDVGAPIEQGPNRGRVPGLDRVDQGNPRRLRRSRRGGGDHDPRGQPAGRTVWAFHVRPLSRLPCFLSHGHTVSGSRGSRPVLSPSCSGSRTPALSSMASSRLVIGVSLG